jgi:hypothetical protein
MTRKLDDAVNRWLAEEAGGESVSPDAAETALAEVFRRWPAPHPPRGFALAVLRRAGIARRRADAFASGWVHAGIAAALVLAGVALLFVPAAARLAGWVFRPSELVELGSRALVSASQTLAGALDLWGFLSRLGSALAVAVATPQAALSLILVALCAGGALRALNGLIPAERSV